MGKHSVVVGVVCFALNQALQRLGCTVPQTFTNLMILALGGSYGRIIQFSFVTHASYHHSHHDM